WRPDIFAGERPSRDASRRGNDRPTEDSTRADTDVDTHRIESALASFGPRTIAGGVTAFHGLMASDDEADARIEPARQHAGLCPCFRNLRGYRRDKNKQHHPR